MGELVSLQRYREKKERNTPTAGSIELQVPLALRPDRTQIRFLTDSNQPTLRFSATLPDQSEPVEITPETTMEILRNGGKVIVEVDEPFAGETLHVLYKGQPKGARGTHQITTSYQYQPTQGWRRYNGEFLLRSPVKHRGRGR